MVIGREPGHVTGKVSSLSHEELWKSGISLQAPKDRETETQLTRPTKDIDDIKGKTEGETKRRTWDIHEKFVVYSI